jgi:hypothetical protein
MTKRVTHTYVIGSDEFPGVVKIGKSIHPEKRLRDLQAGSPVALRVLHLWPFDIETDLHNWFRPYRRHLEWFRVPLDDVIVAGDIVREKGRDPLDVLRERLWDIDPPVMTTRQIVCPVRGFHNAKTCGRRVVTADVGGETFFPSKEMGFRLGADLHGAVTRDDMYYLCLSLFHRCVHGDTKRHLMPPSEGGTLYWSRQWAPEIWWDGMHSRRHLYVEAALELANMQRTFHIFRQWSKDLFDGVVFSVVDVRCDLTRETAKLLRVSDVVAAL